MSNNEKTELEQKQAFAIELLKNPNDSFKAAIAALNDPGLALNVHAVWPYDQDVLDFQTNYVEQHGKEIGLPTKEVYARKVWDTAETTRDPDVSLKALKLYGEIRGFLEKPGTTVNNNIQNVSNKVMVVPAIASAKEDKDVWAKNLKDQQTKLTNDNTD